MVLGTVVLLFDRLDPDCLEKLLGLGQGTVRWQLLGCTRSPLFLIAGWGRFD